MSAPGVTVLELVARHRRTAAEIERYNAATAETIRTLAEEYERAVRDSMPEWWTLAAVQQAKGWRAHWLRRRCQRLQHLGMARKGSNHHWLMRWDAVLELPDRQAPREEVDPGEDIDALAETLARTA